MAFIFLFIFILNKKLKFLYYAVATLYFFSIGFVSTILVRYIEKPWQRLDFNNIDHVDAIVVLGSGGFIDPPGKTSIIEWSDPDRFNSGLELFNAGKAKKLIFTGGFNPYFPNLPPEGDIYIEEVIKRGLSIDNMMTTKNVYNTFQEAKAIKNLINKSIPLNKNKIILVTSAFHMKRAKKIFERENFIVKPYPVDFISKKATKKVFLYNPYNWLPNSNSLNESSIVFREIIGRIVYRSW